MDAIYEQNYHISMKKIIFRKIATDCINFFVLVSLSIGIIIWVLQAVNYLDYVIEDGHGLFVYFNYTLLNFPKIISRIFPFALFISITYILLKYENNNELIIFWNFGINKKKFINFFIKLSFGFVVLNLVLNVFIVPTTQEKAKIFLRSSDIDYFESILRPKKFIDSIRNLTIYFEEKTIEEKLKNIYLKQITDENNFQLTFAKTGEFEFRGNRKILVLHNGIKINNKEGKNSQFEFSKTDIDLSKFNSNTNTYKKNQEYSTKQLIGCIFILQKQKEENNDYNPSHNFPACKAWNAREIFVVLYQRLIQPFFNTILVMIALLLILKSKDSHDFKRYKLKIYTLGFLFVLFFEGSSKFLNTNLLFNISISMLPIFLFFLIYIYILVNLKANNK